VIILLVISSPLILCFQKPHFWSRCANSIKGYRDGNCHLIGKCSKGRRHNSTKISKEQHTQKRNGGNLAIYAAIPHPINAPRPFSKRYITVLKTLLIRSQKVT